MQFNLELYDWGTTGSRLESNPAAEKGRYRVQTDNERRMASCVNSPLLKIKIVPSGAMTDYELNQMIARQLTDIPYADLTKIERAIGNLLVSGGYLKKESGPDRRNYLVLTGKAVSSQFGN